MGRSARAPGRKGSRDMNRIAFTAAAAALLAGTSAHAVGLDRSAQNIGILFEEGDYAELSFGYVAPDIEGSDEVGGLGTGDVANNYFTGSIGYKQQVTDQLSFAIILDQPYGADITYADGPLAGGSGSATLGGTGAKLSSAALSVLGRYEFGNGFSAHGGIRAQQISGLVNLGGGRFSGLDGYSTTVDSDIDFGYTLGVAYEIPDIALRVALTYFSEIDHDIDTVENLPGATPPGGFASSSEVTTPQAVNLDFQTGVAEDTLLFGQIRWADYEAVSLSPTVFNGAVIAGGGAPGASLVGIDSNYRYTVGVGRRFTDEFSGAISLTYEADEGDSVSPLGPTDGSIGLTLGGTYDTGTFKITGGINYTKLGDTFVEATDPTTGATFRTTSFDDNDAIGLGLRIGYRY